MTPDNEINPFLLEKAMEDVDKPKEKHNNDELMFRTV